MPLIVSSVAMSTRDAGRAPGTMNSGKNSTFSASVIASGRPDWIAASWMSGRDSAFCRVLIGTMSAAKTLRTPMMASMSLAVCLRAVPSRTRTVFTSASDLTAATLVGVVAPAMSAFESAAHSVSTPSAMKARATDSGMSSDW